MPGLEPRTAAWRYTKPGSGTVVATTHVTHMNGQAQVACRCVRLFDVFCRVCFTLRSLATGRGLLRACVVLGISFV